MVSSSGSDRCFYQSWVCRVLVAVVGVALVVVNASPVFAAPTPVPAPAAPVALGGLPSDTARRVVEGSVGSPARAEEPEFVEKRSPEQPGRPSGAEKGYVAGKSRPAERGQSWTDYVNPDGSHTRQLSTDVINFKDAQGRWAAVDNAVVADGPAAVW